MNDFIQEWLNCGTLFSIARDRVIIGWGKKEKLEGPDVSRPSFYFPDFFLSHSYPWFVYEKTLELSVNELINHLSTIPALPKKSYPWHSPHQLLFHQVFNEIQAKISLGKLKKAVPFVIESVDIPMDRSQLTKSLHTILNYFTRHPAHIYGFWDDNEGLLGATPEMLFQQRHERVLQTVACAGTKRIQDDSTTFLSDSKELYEHHLVVQGITESLKPHGEVTVGNLQLLKLSQLVHLTTPLSVQLKAKIAFEEIVKVLHPTPAVGAFPKNEGNKWLEDYQKQVNRMRFGAPAGYYLPESKQSDCMVAIRNVQWDTKGMQLSAGCGIVADSQLDREWTEINLKFEAIKEILAL